MIKLGYIILIVSTLAFLFCLIWGKPAKEEPKDKIVWKKLDDHEKAISE
jgi:hypothetical protein